MQGLRSKNPIVLPLDTEIERTIRQKPRDNDEEEEEELQIEEAMAEQHVNQLQLGNKPPLERRPMKQFLILTIPTSHHTLPINLRQKAITTYPHKYSMH
jgi:hypothetical protein